MKIILSAFWGLFLLASFASANEDPATFELDPAYEGIFEVSIECRDEPKSEACAKVNVKTKMVVLNNHLKDYGPFGTLVSFIDPQSSDPKALYYFQIQYVKNAGAVLIGETLDSAENMAEIYLQINSKRCVYRAKFVSSVNNHHGRG